MPSTTVAPEYARYQAWHVAQDLSTQLRSTLATSAVFQGLGMGSGNAATALAATVAWLSRDASGMVASLAATARLAPRLDGDCRRWRFLGDVCVDAALVIELATPHAPRSMFVPMLCAASVCTSTPGRARLHAAEISAIGCTAPTCGWCCNKSQMNGDKSHQKLLC